MKRIADIIRAVRIETLLIFTKVTVALALIALSLWAMALPPLFPTSVRALVNARAIVIHAEDSGRVRELPLIEGAAVKTGAVIAGIERNQRAMQKELDDLLFARQRVEAQIETLTENLAFRKSDMELKTKDLKVIQGEALETLQQRHADAVERVDIFEQDVQVKTENEKHLAPLLKDRVITSAQWNHARALTIETRKNLQAAREERDRLQRELNQAEASLWAGESQVGESLMSAIEQHRQEIQKLSMQHIELTVQRHNLDQQIASAEAYLQADHAYSLASPSDGMVWRRNVLPGQSVLQGEELVQVAVRDTLFVEAYFGRHFIDSISISDHAHIYLISEKRFVQGIVREIQAQERGAREQHIIQSVAPDTTMLKTIIEITDDTVKPAQIGQLARVMISKPKPGPTKKAMVWISLMLRSDS